MNIYHQIFQNNFSIVKEFYALSTDHWHQNMEMVYVLSGQAQIRIGNTVRLCNPGDMAIMHSGEIHAVHGLEKSALYICIFDANLIRNLHSEMKFIQNFISAEELKENGVGDRILGIFDEIFLENAEEESWNDVVIHADLMRIYALLVRNFERNNAEKSQNYAKIQHFQEALFFIEEEYAQNITLADVASAINYNPNYVSSMFVTYTGQNFKKYLDSFRVNKAIELIKLTEDTFADISVKCGFANIRTFNNAFRRVTGTTPSRLRQGDDEVILNGDCEFLTEI